MKKFEVTAIFLIVILGAFLRLYHLPQVLIFRGDQGRDAIIAKNILKEKDIALIGPVTSVGNMYLGPLYYYFMVPFLVLTYPDPVGPAYGVALLNVLTIYLIYIVGKKTINTKAGLLASLLFAIMPIAIIYGRFSWNPNIAPFFSILIFYALVKWWKKRSSKMFFWVAFLIGLLIQTHYVSLTVAFTAGLMWLYRLITDKQIKKSLKELFWGILGFLITTIPLIAFDFRHNHLITRQFVNFFLSPEKHIRSIGFWDQINLMWSRAEYVLASLLHSSTTTDLDKLILIGGLGLALIYSLKLKSKLMSSWFIIGLWLITAIVGTSFYSHTTFPHYLTYCLPIIALFWASLITKIWEKKHYLLSLGLGLIIFGITVLGLPQVGWTGGGTMMLQQAVNLSFPNITTPYNITLLSDDKDYKGMSYRYFFEVSGKKPLSLEDYGDLETLVLIDETFLDDPLVVPIYEIEVAKDFVLEKQIIIPKGPWVYIYKKG